jgi:diadenosine tetraphosphate (Ap4A) HIT family hydrolase
MLDDDGWMMIGGGGKSKVFHLHLHSINGYGFESGRESGAMQLQLQDGDASSKNGWQNMQSKKHNTINTNK